MANKTIYGCFNTSTGVVTFVGEACNAGDYVGCYTATGEHAGQIAVVVSEASCADTYYACFNPTTGQFQLIIPDDCCIEYGNNCGYCDAGKTPRFITLYLNDWTQNCTGCYAHDGGSSRWTDFSFLVGSPWVLEQYPEPYPCSWRYTNDNGVSIIRSLYTDEYCENLFEGSEFNYLDIIVQKSAANTCKIWIQTVFGGFTALLFRNLAVAVSGNCIEVTTASNQIACSKNNLSTNGTVTIEER